jgi:hypothetical protein
LNRREGWLGKSAEQHDRKCRVQARQRRLNPELGVKWLQTVAPKLPLLFEGVRKAGLPEE